MEQCMAFDIGKVKITADQVTLDFKENRTLCHKNGDFSFKYGTMISNNEIFLVGKSIKPKKNIQNYEFNVDIYVNNKKVMDKKIDYTQVVDLFTKENNSKIINEIKKYFPTYKSPSPKVRQLVQKDQKNLPIKKPTSAVFPLTQKSQKNRSQQSQKTKNQFGVSELSPGKKEGYVVNPLTGKEVKIGGKTYYKLCETLNITDC